MTLVLTIQNMKYSFVRLSKETIPDLLPIFLSAFGYSPTLNSLRESYNTDYTGISNVGYIVYNELNEPVSFYGVFPMLANIKGSIKLISQSGNTMTRKEDIGKGLFITSAELTYNLCKENKITGVFGFPSRASYPGFKKKLNWTFKEFINRYSFFVPTLPLSILTQKVKFIGTIYLCWVKIILLFYKKADFFEGSIIQSGQDGIYRDKSLWDYKLKVDNNFAIKIDGVNLVFKLNGKLSIGDIGIIDESPIKPILSKLRVLAFLTFNTHIVFYVSPETLLDKVLNNISQSSNGLPIGFLNFGNDVDLSTLKFTFFDFDTF